MSGANALPPLYIFTIFLIIKGDLLTRENVRTKDKRKEETCQSSTTPPPGNALITFFTPVFSFYSPGSNFWLWKEDWALNGGSWVPPRKGSLPETVFYRENTWMEGSAYVECGGRGNIAEMGRMTGKGKQAAR